MKVKTFSSAVVIIALLFLLPAFAISPAVAHAAAVSPNGLYGEYWKGSFFGSPAPTWPTCPTDSTPVPNPPAGVPSSTAPTAWEIDPVINFGSTTNFYWDESYAAGTPYSSDIAGPPGNPGGFAVTDGSTSGVSLASWGDKSLYTDYPTSTFFVDTDFSVEWTGWISLTGDTTYHFSLDSDDGAVLYINPTAGSPTISSADQVINSWFVQPPTPATGTFSASTTGKYAIEIDYYETCDTQSGIDFSWQGPTGGYSIVPTSVLWAQPLGSNAPPTTSGVPEFNFGLPLAAVIGFLAIVLVRRKLSVLPRIVTTT